MTDSNKGDNIKSFKGVMYRTTAGRMIVTGAVITGLVLGYQMVDSYLIKKPEPIEQKQVIGNEEPDTFIERDGVKYFSHADGQSISDLVKE